MFCKMISQVYLLAAPASTSSLIIFRTHLGLLNGALLALTFPVTDAYSLPGEVCRNPDHSKLRWWWKILWWKLEDTSFLMMVMVVFSIVQPLLDPACGNAACSFSPKRSGSHPRNSQSSISILTLVTFQGHPYTPPSKRSVAWPVFSYCVFFLFHIIVLQPVAFLLHVNLDYVLCPAPRCIQYLKVFCIWDRRRIFLNSLGRD